MQDGFWQIVQVIAGVLIAIGAVVLAPLKWSVGRLIKQTERNTSRIENLERNKVTREDLDKFALRSAAERLQLHTEHKEMLGRIVLKLDAIEPAAIMAGRMTRVEQDIREWRDWKQERLAQYLTALDVLKSRMEYLEINVVKKP